MQTFVLLCDVNIRLEGVSFLSIYVQEVLSLIGKETTWPVRSGCGNKK